MPAADDDPETLEALRRSLYRPGTDADAAARYRRAVGEPEEAERPDQGLRPPEPQAVRVRRPRLGLIAALASGVCAVALLGALSSTLAASPSAPSARPTPSPSPSLTASDGVRSETLGLDARDRTAITTALESGSRAGLAFLVDFHPELRPAALRTARRYGIVELDGTGPGTTRILGGAAARSGGAGRVTVLLVTARDVEANWSVVGISDRPSQPLRPVPILRLQGEHRPGEPVAASARYEAGGEPDLLSVRVPPGVRWGAAIVFSR